MIRANIRAWGSAHNAVVDGDTFMIDEDHPPALPREVVFEFESRKTTTFAERFTFVRDPLTRFISGYKEVAFREHALGHGPESLRKEKNHTVAAIMTIEALLDGRWRDLSTDMVHVSATERLFATDERQRCTLQKCAPTQIFARICPCLTVMLVSILIIAILSCAPHPLIIIIFLALLVYIPPTLPHFHTTPPHSVSPSLDTCTVGGSTSLAASRRWKPSGRL